VTAPPATGAPATPPSTLTAAPQPVPLRWAFSLAFLSSVLYFAAFPGIDIWPLAFVAVIPLRIALRGQSAKRGLLIGWTTGFWVTMIGFYWLLDMLKAFSGFGLPLCLVFMAVLCAYQGGRLALWGWLSTRITNKGWPEPVAFTIAFATSELVFPLLFPWYFGATVHQVPVLTQVAEIGNPILVGVVLVIANLAISEVILNRMDRRPIRWKVIAPWAAVPVAAAIYGVIRIPQIDARVAAAPKAKAAVIQGNMSLKGKREDRNEGLRRHLALSEQANEKGPLDLIVWSETSVAGAMEQDRAFDFYKSQITTKFNAPMIFGGVLYEKAPPPKNYTLYNTALASDRQGEIVGRFDKQYLLAFGEYIPFGDIFPMVYELSPNSGRFSPGPNIKPIELDGHGIAILICYEDVIPGFTNDIVQSGKTELLVNVTNDAWFGDTTEPWIHMALSKFRAIEQRRFLMRANNSGISAFVDPVGRMISHTQPFVQAELVDEIAWLDHQTIYGFVGNIPWWIVSGVAVVLAFVPRRRRD
jgi:apolipoprotein N-acyltransferase